MTKWTIVRACLLGAAVFLSQFGRLDGAETARAGRIQFSNGESIEGKISLSQGTDLRIHDGNNISSVPLAHVREIRIIPENERMEQKWRFIEAGRTEKERSGKPYPLREFRATVCLAGDKSLIGHLYTTTLYVESTNGTRKIVLFAKERGQEGQTFDDVVFPSRIEFADQAASFAGSLRLRVSPADDKGALELIGLTHGALLRLEARREGNGGGGFVLPSTLGSRAFLAARTASGIAVAWPGADTSVAGGVSNAVALSSRIEEALKDASDFFDGREILGVYRESAVGDIYSLLLLCRIGATTGGHPWAVGIWRWKEGEDSRLMLAGRGNFFRGLCGDAPKSGAEVRRDETRADARKGSTRPAGVPTIRLSPKMWNQELKDGAVLSLEND